MKIDKKKIIFFSVLSGNDDQYTQIKNNFIKQLNSLELDYKHKLFITDTENNIHTNTMTEIVDFR